MGADRRHGELSKRCWSFVCAVLQAILHFGDQKYFERKGGIAYRQVADNYIALFSRFIACGTYEATYILDAG